MALLEIKLAELPAFAWCVPLSASSWVKGLASFSRGEKLDGFLIAHPVNAFRKVIIATELGVFNLNEEDFEEVW